MLPTLAIAVAIVGAVILYGQLRSTFDPDLRRAQAAERYRQAQIAEQIRGVDTIVAAGWKLLPLALVAGAGVVALGTAWRRWARHEYIRASHVTALTKASTQRFPAALHSLSFHDSSKMQPPALLPEAPQLAGPVADVPTFRSALDAGMVGLGMDGRRQPLILGYDAATGKPIEGSWKDLYSAGIGALQGAGKSWLEAFLLSQSAAQGARLIICDPHAGHEEESLSARIAALRPAFLCDVAQTDREVLDALRLANDELERRKMGKGKTWPLIIAVDEWTSLLRGELADLLPIYATNFAEAGRKFNVNGLFSAQGWTKDAAGLVRNRLTAHYVLRQRPDEARYQLGLRASQMPDDIRTLPDATGYLLTTRGVFTKIVIPKMTPADLEIVGAGLGRSPVSDSRSFGFAPARRETAAQADSNQIETDRESGVNRAQTPDTLSPDVARVLALFAAGKTIGEIVKALWGELSGTPYNRKREEVEAIIRSVVISRA
jgi:hypothetical protein